MIATIPAKLLALKKRFDDWRANRQHLREPIPDELRRAVLEMSRHYPRTLVRQILKVDPHRLQKPTPKPPARTTVRKKPTATFIQLSPPISLPELGASPPPSATDTCRLQLERPDGSRLTLTLPVTDSLTINRLCADFLRGSDR